MEPSGTARSIEVPPAPSFHTPNREVDLDLAKGSGVNALILNSGRGGVLGAAMSWLFNLLLLCALTTSAFGQDVKVYVSSEAGDRLTPKPTARFGPRVKVDYPTFRIATGNMMQRMAGFGATFQEAGMISLNDLPPQDQEAVLRALFDPDQGAGFSAMRIPIAGADFMSAGPWYSYDETAGDLQMEHFSIQRDLGPNGVLTYVLRARKYGNFVLQAAMDYPPHWMAAGSEKQQAVDPKYFDALARYFLRYLQEYQKQGVFVDYVSLFSESRADDEGHIGFPFAGVRDLLKNHVGPLFRKEGVKTRIMPAEASSRLEAYEHNPTVLDDLQARQYVDAIPYQGYDARGHGGFDKIAALHNAYADLPLWMTEVSHVGDSGASRATSLPRYDFEDGALWGNMIVSDIEAGASAWIYGNMILDQRGGPWLVSPVHRAPDPDAQQPVVIINRKTGKVSYTGLYYYLAHFSKFVKPGAQRVLMEGDYPGVRGVAFLSPERDGAWHWVVELLNNRPAAAQVQVDFDLNWVRRSLQLTLPANSITTCLWNPLPHTLGNMPIKPAATDSNASGAVHP